MVTTPLPPTCRGLSAASTAKRLDTAHKIEIRWAGLVGATPS